MVAVAVPWNTVPTTGRLDHQLRGYESRRHTKKLARDVRERTERDAPDNRPRLTPKGEHRAVTSCQRREHSTQLRDFLRQRAPDNDKASAG
jgi:hypothetical protein